MRLGICYPQYVQILTKRRAHSDISGVAFYGERSARVNVNENAS